MKIFANMLMVVALVIATSFPDVSHAMMSHDAAKANNAEFIEHGDCHHHAKAAQSSHTAHNHKETGHCCDKGVCKCIGGNCYSLLKFLGNGGGLVSTRLLGGSVFAFADVFGDSMLSNCLRRPPKA
jgi:hypothetical protein